MTMSIICPPEEPLDSICPARSALCVIILSSSLGTVSDHLFRLNLRSLGQAPALEEFLAVSIVR